MRIGIDARLAGTRHAGIGRYSEEFLREIIRVKTVCDQPVTWVIWTDPKNELVWLRNAAEKSTHLELHEISLPHYGVLEQVVWPWILLRAKLDLLHVLHFNVPLMLPVPFVVTIHDLLWHQERDSQATTLSPVKYRLKYGAYRLISESAIRRAQAVIVPTRVVANDVAQFVGRRDDVHIVPEGIADAYRQVEKATVREREKTLLYVGSLYPHKNIEVVLQALQQLPDMKLTLVGSRNVFQDAVRQRVDEMGLADRVEFAGKLSDEAIRTLYQRVFALIQPSRSEGFGLTGLEAMASGCPVLASDIPVFHEVYGAHAQFFSASQSESFRIAVRAMEKNPLNAVQLQAAQTHARSYSWQKMTSEISAIYTDVLGK